MTDSLCQPVVRVCVFCDQKRFVSANTPSSPGEGVFNCLSRPDQGREGRLIYLRANHFKIKLPNIDIFHYDVSITPEKCPRRVNREVIDTMFRANSKIFQSGHRPVYDGRKNLYSKTPLVNSPDPVSHHSSLKHNSFLSCLRFLQLEIDVTLPSDESRERVFKVCLQFVNKVSLGQLDQVLERKNQHPPLDSIQALDVIMRHFPSIKLKLFCYLLDEIFTLRGLKGGCLCLQLHSSGTFILLASQGLLPPTRGRERGVVRIPSVGETESLENDAEHRRFRHRLLQTAECHRLPCRGARLEGITRTGIEPTAERLTSCQVHQRDQRLPPSPYFIFVDVKIKQGSNS